MSESCDPIVTVAIPENHGPCAICGHDYGAHYVSYDGQFHGCTEWPVPEVPCFCEGYAALSV